MKKEIGERPIEGLYRGGLEILLELLNGTDLNGQIKKNDLYFYARLKYVTGEKYLNLLCSCGAIECKERYYNLTAKGTKLLEDLDDAKKILESQNVN